MQYVDYYESPLGKITMASDGEALTGLWFENQKYYGAGLESQAKACELEVFSITKQWLDCYFRGEQPSLLPKLAPQGSEFRMAVWEVLRNIPYGKTVTYGEIAAQLAQQKGLRSMSAQAVGGAVGHNPISIIIPCHRVVGSDGSLTGYAGGLDKKLALLKLEKILESNSCSLK